MTSEWRAESGIYDVHLFRTAFGQYNLKTTCRSQGGLSAYCALLSMEDIQRLRDALSNLGKELACPPDCCGEQMQAKRLIVDGFNCDMWYCERCGRYRNRRV